MSNPPDRAEERQALERFMREANAISDMEMKTQANIPGYVLAFNTVADLVGKLKPSTIPGPKRRRR